MELLTDCDHVAVFDADFKPDPDFLVNELSHSLEKPVECDRFVPVIPSRRLI